MSRRMTVAIQGEAGAFSHEAAVDALGSGLELRPQHSFDALCDDVLGGGAERGVMPIENSLVGSIHENYDRLRGLPLHIVGETQLRIRHCLIGRPGSSLTTVRHVSSHPVALAQCRRFFRERPEIQEHASYDTAGSVKALVRDGLMGQAVIASRVAAELYGGAVLLEGLEDDPENWTRFLLIAREPGPVAGDKTSLVLNLPHRPGSLHEALGVFAARGLDLAKIESRPLRGRPWEYTFYLDVLGPAGEVAAALDALRALASDVRVLGCYPRGTRSVH
jgi:prephenate dehydratase